MLNGDIDTLELTGDITSVLSLEGDLLPIGPKGDKGDPGFSPVVTTSKSGKTTTIQFETATGNVYAYIQDGEDGQGSGDMMTDVYDQNKNGIVDNAEKVNNHTVEKDVPANAVFTDTVYDDTEVRGLINAKPNFSDIPTNVSQLTNDANYVTSNGNAKTTQTNVSSATFNNTLVAPMNIDLKGNTLQNGTPTPSSPIPVNNVSGDNDIVVCGKNLFDKTTMVYGEIYYLPADTTSTQLRQMAGGGGVLIIKLQEGSTYTISKRAGARFRAGFTTTPTPVANTNNVITSRVPNNDTGTSITFSVPTGSPYFVCNFFSIDQTTDANIGYENMLNTIQIEKGNQATTYEAYNGTTYNIDLPVENLCNGINQGYWLNQAANSCGKSTYDSGLVVAVNGGNYTISTSASQTRYRVACLTSLPDDSQVSAYNGVNKDNTSNSITIDTTGYNYLIVNATDLTKIQIEQGSKANSYTPYGTTPIELNKIGTYQDYFYKENDKWYLHKEIGKVVLNGSEEISRMQTISNFRFCIEVSSNIIKVDGADAQNPIYCNRFRAGNRGETYNEIQCICYGVSTTTDYKDLIIYCNDTKAMTIDDFKTWLSTHNTIVNYVLATPTNTEITYTPLIEQLESIKNAMSKQGTTNVNQVNNDAPFILDLSVFNDTYNGRYQSVLEMYKRLKEAE